MNDRRPETPTAESDAAERREATDDSPPIDVLGRALAHPWRRWLLHRLADRAEPVSVADLARQLAVWDANGEIDAPSDAARERVAATVRREHLPALVGTDLVTYDPTCDLVELTVRAAPLTRSFAGDPPEPSDPDR